MHISGQWYSCDDGITRPVIRGEILTGVGFWEPALFLVDTGADRTVFSAAKLAALRMPAGARQERLGGVGGVVESVVVEAQIRLTYDGAEKVVFRGGFAAFTELEALDMSVLGRDITGLFAVIVDQPGNVVSLIGQRHRYVIERS